MKLTTTLYTTLPLLSALTLPATAHSHAPLSLPNLAHARTRLHAARSTCGTTRALHCLLAAEANEGPFYIPHPLVRANITEDRPGVPLRLHVSVVDVATCAPPDQPLWVDIWHADALGVYSGWAAHAEAGAAASWALDDHDRPSTPPSHGGPPHHGGPPPHHDPITPDRWLRGVQPLTPSTGLATFSTIFPGWYVGRTTHIHVRVHAGNATVAGGEMLGGGRTAHTGQVFFADELVTRIAGSREPYVSRGGRGPMLNGEDRDFEGGRGWEQVVEIREMEGELEGWVTVGVDVEADYGDGQEGMEGGEWKWVGVVGVVVAGGVVVGVAVWGMMRWFAKRRERAGYVAVGQGEGEGQQYRDEE